MTISGIVFIPIEVSFRVQLDLVALTLSPEAWFLYLYTLPVFVLPQSTTDPPRGIHSILQELQLFFLWKPKPKANQNRINTNKQQQQQQKIKSYNVSSGPYFLMLSKEERKRKSLFFSCRHFSVMPSPVNISH